MESDARSDQDDYGNDVEGSFLLVDAVKRFLVELFMKIHNNDSNGLKTKYFSEFSELTESYYKESEWPIFEEISNLITIEALFPKWRMYSDSDYTAAEESFNNSKSLFGLLYTELCFRHVFLHGKPLLHHRVQSYDNYLRLFDHLMTSKGQIQLPLEWLSDMLDEFLYQFEDYCSHRHEVSALTEEELEDLQIMDDDGTAIFEVSQTLQLLEAMSAYFTDSTATPRSMLWNLGYIATLGLSRVNVLLADYNLALKCLKKVDLEDKRGMFTRLNSMHVTLFYYTGFSYLMLRRYSDAVQLFSAILLSHRSVGRQKMRLTCYADSQFQRKYEKLRNLCCVAVALSVGYVVEDNLKNVLDDARSGKKTGGSFGFLQSLLKRGEGEDDKTLELFRETFDKNSPRFITPRRSDYKTLTNRQRETADAQCEWFMREVEAQLTVPELRSLLKLYSSISLEKLSQLAQLSQPELIQALLLIKYKSQQFLRGSGETSTTATAAHNDEFFHTDGVFESVADVHFFVENNLVSVSEKPRKLRFADFFLQNALKLGQCANDLKSTGGSRSKAWKKSSGENHRTRK